MLEGLPQACSTKAVSLARRYFVEWRLRLERKNLWTREKSIGLLVLRSSTSSATRFSRVTSRSDRHSSNTAAPKDKAGIAAYPA